MTGSAQIRPAEPTDAEAVAEVHVVSRRAYYQAGGAAVPDDSGTSADRQCFWSNTLSDEANHSWIAEDDGAPLGLIIAGPPVHDDLKGQPVLALIALYVIPTMWGSGIAAELHDRFVDLMSNTAVVEGALDVWKANHRALAFYLRRGWTLDGRTRAGPASHPFIGLRLPWLLEPKG